jgi:hypothetical protein
MHSTLKNQIADCRFGLDELDKHLDQLAGVYTSSKAGPHASAALGRIRHTLAKLMDLHLGPYKSPTPAQEE